MAAGDGHQDATSADEPSLGPHADALWDAVVERLGPLVEGWVTGRLLEAFGALEDAGRAAAGEAAGTALADVAPRLRALLDADIDAQWTTPLTLLRRAVPHATAALDRFGTPEVPRDRFARERFPEDRYGLTPASMAALGGDVEELAVVWGAAKALAHRRRHLRPPR